MSQTDHPPVHPRISVNMVSSMGWSLDQDIAFYTSRGVRTVTGPWSKLGDPMEAGIEAIRRAGLNVVTVGGAGASMSGAALIDGPEAALELLKPTIAAAQALGAVSAYFIAGPTPPRMPTDEAFDRLVTALRPVGAYARERGVKLMLEPNSHATRATGFVHTLADAAELSRAADVDICVEFQNCWYERHLDRLFRDNLDRIGIVQVNDFVVGEELRLNRRAPGDGAIPLEWMMGLLLEAGYEGFFDLEILGPAIEKEGYESALDRGLVWLSERLTRWGV